MNTRLNADNENSFTSQAAEMEGNSLGIRLKLLIPFFWYGSTWFLSQGWGADVSDGWQLLLL